MTRILFMADVPNPEHSAGLTVTLRHILAEIEKRDAGTGRVVGFPEPSGHCDAITILLDGFAEYVRSA